MSTAEGVEARTQAHAPKAGISRIILYVRDVEMSASFYAFFFGFKVMTTPTDRLTELFMEDGGARLLLHKAGKAQKLGQVSLKLVFDVEDVSAFSIASAEKGLKFGTIHQADGYQFANAKDPDGNAIQISSRAFNTQ